MEPTIESQRDGDDEQRHALGRQAFGGTDPYRPGGPAIDPDRVVCAYLGDRMVGATTTLAHHLSWRGRRVACGGVAGVVVQPEVRGRGLARRMLAESFERMAARDEVLSSLYPTTATLYRSLGYEVAGWYVRRRIPTDAIPLAAADELDWQAVPLDDPAIRAVHERMATDVDGFVVPDDHWWARRRHRLGGGPDSNRFAYVGRRAGEDVAAVVYSYTRSDTRLYGLEAEFLVGVDGRAQAGALAFLARNGTAADHLVTVAPGSVLEASLPQVQQTTVASDWPWMLRLVDAAGAIAGRGYPTPVSGRVELEISDAARPGNAGPHVLEIEAGHGELIRGGAGRVAVDVTDLARIYTGHDVRTLAAARRIPGADAAAIDLLSAAFVSSPGATIFY